MVDPQGHRIGTIKRLLIEKVSGRVVYVDVTFGGFLGLGVHHRTIPWEKLAYDKQLRAIAPTSPRSRCEAPRLLRR